MAKERVSPNYLSECGAGCRPNNVRKIRWCLGIPSKVGCSGRFIWSSVLALGVAWFRNCNTDRSWVVPWKDQDRVASDNALLNLTLPGPTRIARYKEDYRQCAV